MNTIQQLRYLLDKKTKLKLIGIIIMIIIGSFAELIAVAIIQPIIQLATDSKSVDNSRFVQIIKSITGYTQAKDVLLCLVILIIAIYIVKNIYICIMFNQQFRFSSIVKRDLAGKLMTSYLKQPYSFFLKKNSSDLIRSVNEDTSQLFQLIINLCTLVTQGITAVVLVVYLAYNNIFMTLSVAVLLGICLIIVVFVVQKSTRRNGRIHQELSGQMIKYLRQSFEGVKEIKIMHTENYFISTYKDAYKKNTDIEVSYSLTNTLPRYLIEVFAIVGIMGYLGVNIWLNANYMEMLPSLAVFCAAAFKLLPSVNQLYASFNMIVYYKASIDLVYRDIKEANELDNTFEKAVENIKEFKFDNSVELKDVSFQYESADVPVLEDINLTIRKGTSVAFIGASGGGKTTTADIILSLLEPTKGSVLVDGTDIKDNIWGWRSKLGYIPQFIYITDDTIRNNVAFGIDKEKIDDEAVWNALRDSKLEDFVKTLPEGLDTVVGERGARISGGQRQRIGIARALYRNPEILIFDEATSALDNETEKEVMKAIDGLQGTKTIIMIAHRLSTIEKCDEVYKIENRQLNKQR